MEIETISKVSLTRHFVTNFSLGKLRKKKKIWSVTIPNWYTASKIAISRAPTVTLRVLMIAINERKKKKKWRLAYGPTLVFNRLRTSYRLRRPSYLLNRFLNGLLACEWWWWYSYYQWLLKHYNYEHDISLCRRCSRLIRSWIEIHEDRLHEFQYQW